MDAKSSDPKQKRDPEDSSPDLVDQCGVCGSGNPIGSGFCRQCGAGLNEREPQPVEAKPDQGDTQEKIGQLETLRDSAIQLEAENRNREAEQAWHRVLDIQPEHRQAVAAIERIRGRTHDEHFLEKAGEFRSAIEERAVSRATQLLHELRTIAAPAASSELGQLEQTL